MAFTHTDERGCSPIGSKVCFQRHPLNACASIPKGRERIIQVQFISWNSTCLMLEKSKPRYIQYKIALPSNKGNAIFMMLFRSFSFSYLRAKITKNASKMQNKIPNFVGQINKNYEISQAEKESRTALSY